MTTTSETAASVGTAIATGTEFSRYVNSVELLSLQRPRTASTAEPCFLITTQVMELLFKLSYLEARAARDLLTAGREVAALAGLRRLHEVQRLTTQGWSVLATLSPAEYLEYRDVLGDGSGFQSYAFRQWECVLGKKNRELMRPYLDDPRVAADLTAALVEPSLYDVVLHRFAEYGIDLPEGCLGGEGSGRPRPAVELAWKRVYQERERFAGLHRLGEALVDVAYEFARWQATHVLVVERVLGVKTGTAGTSGVAWLRQAGERRLFPELWSVRGAM
ncbi:tryptophan 2,3-dioxygenase [Amycolatopsis sp. NPDC088138]|uniref:tryptophan 2,3-dioxygenase n=1 Tax=Amycolatopsis sp. NPDC088138 TaxID=3363938 RepID=UPI003821AB68